MAAAWRWLGVAQRRSTVFVYGTLRRGCSAHGLLRPAEPLGAGAVRGYTLLAEGQYPAAVEAPRRCRVVGEVYRVPGYVLARLDRYEGGLYERRRVRVEVEGVGVVEAWMYVSATLGPARRCFLEEWVCRR